MSSIPPPPSWPVNQPVPQPDNKAWWETPIAIVASLMCCFPVGLALVWMSKKLTQTQKIVITSIVAFLLVAGGIGSLLAPRDKETVSVSTPNPTTPATQSTTTETTTPQSTTTETSTTVATTTTAAPTTTEKPFQSIKLEGNGDDIKTELDLLTEPVILKITHQGESNFMVRVGSDLIVNEIGNYKGRIGIASGATLEIRADGEWTIETQPMSSAILATAGAAGRGDEVLFLDPIRKPYAVSHTGESNFVVRGGSGLAVNEIGNYSGKVFIAGPLVEIHADGAWTITPA